MGDKHGCHDCSVVGINVNCLVCKDTKDSKTNWFPSPFLVDKIMEIAGDNNINLIHSEAREIAKNTYLKDSEECVLEKIKKYVED